MIPVFVISLPDCVDRRESIRNGLDNLQIPFEFVDAVDGRNGLDPSHEPDVDRPGTKRMGLTLSDAEFACALSHIHIYRRIDRDNIDWALVLEDDAFPTLDLKTFIKERHYADADLTQLHSFSTRVSRMGQKHLFDSYRSYLRTKFKSQSAAGYVISNHAARHILEYGLPITQPADWPKCVEDLIAEKRIRVVHPHIVRLSPHASKSILVNYRLKHGTWGGGRRFFGQGDVIVMRQMAVEVDYKKSFVRIELVPVNQIDLQRAGPESAIRIGVLPCRSARQANCVHAVATVRD